MKSLTIYLAAYLLVSIASAAAQERINPLWFITRGGPNTDESWGVDTDSAGNIYWATHETVPGPLADIYLYKLSPDGTELWKRRWGDSWNEQAYVVTVDEPYVYVGGTKWTGVWLNSCDMALVCWTTDGDSLWDFTWDGGFGYEEMDGLVADDDTIYAAGWTMGDTTDNDLAVLKLSRDGQLMRSKIWGSPNWDEANGQIVVDDQNVYVAGRYDAQTELSGGDAVLVAFDRATLEYRWHKTWGGDGVDDAYGMIGDGSYLYVVGMTLSFGGSQIFLLKYDRSGNLLWDTLWGGTGAESSRSLAVIDEGDILVAGKTTAYGQGKHDIVLLRYAPDDSLLWFRTWGGVEIDSPHGIVIDGDDVYIASETYSHGAGKNDALLIKANVEGDFPSGIDEEISGTFISPETFSLEQNYPNPFNGSTTIGFHILKPTAVSLKIYDLLGREVQTPIRGQLDAGEHMAEFDGKDLASGIYFYRLRAAGRDLTRKCLLLK